DVADGGGDAPPIVIAFDIGEQVAPRGIAIGVFAVVDEPGFQSAEETLHWRIVPAVSLAAHRLDDSGGLQDVAVVAGGVLTTLKHPSHASSRRRDAISPSVWRSARRKTARSVSAVVIAKAE